MSAIRLSISLTTALTSVLLAASAKEKTGLPVSANKPSAFHFKGQRKTRVNWDVRDSSYVRTSDSMYAGRHDGK